MKMKYVLSALALLMSVSLSFSALPSQEEKTEVGLQHMPPEMLWKMVLETYKTDPKGAVVLLQKLKVINKAFKKMMAAPEVEKPEAEMLWNLILKTTAKEPNWALQLLEKSKLTNKTFKKMLDVSPEKEEMVKKNVSMVTAIEFLKDTSPFEFDAYLDAYKESRNPLSDAIKKKDIKTISMFANPAAQYYLFKKGYIKGTQDINSVDPATGNTLGHIATEQMGEHEFGQEVLEILFANGFKNINKKNNNGFTILDNVVLWGIWPNTFAKDLIEKHGAQITDKAIDIAEGMEFTEFANYLKNYKRR